ncbi:MAG: geranylgeranyl reductase family protein [Methanocellales archaeon]
MERKRCDIAIVGAGPAGSTAAKYAAKHGWEVLLIDKKSEIGIPMQCGGFLPQLHELKLLLPKAACLEELASYPSHCIAAKTDLLGFISPSCEVKRFHVDANIVDRRRFDKYLAQEAARAGAEILLETKVVDLDLENSILKAKELNSNRAFEIEARVIIGADGPASKIARACKLVKNYDPMDISQGFQFEVVDAEIDCKTVEMYFSRKYAPGGYAWIIPTGSDTANVGVGIRLPFAEENLTAKHYLKRFMEEHPLARDKLSQAKVSSIMRGIIPAGGAPSKTQVKNVLIAGDAAGMLMPTSGGGIPLALVAGRIAGETAAKYLQGSASLEEYEYSWRREIGEDLETSLLIRRMLDAFMKNDLLMSSLMKILSAEQMVDLQRGKLSQALKKMLSSAMY